MVQTVGDLEAASAIAAKNAFETERQIYLALLTRKAEFDDKLRFGLFALNGASLVALISALSAGSSVAKWIGLTPENALWSALGFSIGIVLIGVSLFRQQNLEGMQAAHAYGRMSAAGNWTSALHMPANATNSTAALEQMQTYHQTPQVGFQFSWFAIGLLNASAGAWLFGMIVPLASALHPTASAQERSSAPAAVSEKPTSKALLDHANSTQPKHKS